jgi:L,D-peptidoglycan transpeptidase YkuD (ErfK/YbiS/YcfS/YnhG family)
MPRPPIVLAAALALALSLPAAPARAADPERIDSLRGARQAVVVTSTAWRSTHVMVRTYQRVDGRWRLVRGPMPGRIGYNGFSTNRREGDGTTPAGTFKFVFGFGSRPNPGLRGYVWRPLRPGACWSARRADYNRWVTRGCSRGESLWKNRRVAYRYAMVIDFNYRRPVWKRGSGIFLHQQTGGPTAGCVSLGARDLVAVLRWIRPGTRIVMGPAGWVHRR